jgi:hypothetical protein
MIPISTRLVLVSAINITRFCSLLNGVQRSPVKTKRGYFKFESRPTNVSEIQYVITPT